MKKIIYTRLLSLFIGLNFSYAQSVKPIPVPVLKEDKKIDDLMDMAIQKMKTYDPYFKPLLNDSCIMLQMFKWADNDISFQAHRSNKSAVNYTINDYESRKESYGYFNFKGYKVIVWTKNDFSGFFTKTKKHKTLDFIGYAVDVAAPERDQYPDIHFKYADGHFSPEGPPPIK